MFSVKVPKQFEASQGWEWQPDPNPAGYDAPRKRTRHTRLHPVSSTRGALSRSKVSGVAGVGITLLAAGWFVLPAVAARQWDGSRFPAAMPEVLAWDGARNSHTSPQAVLIELAQREGTDGAVVPPVKRQAPQMPDAKTAPAAAPESTTDAAASPQANPTTAQQAPAPTGTPDTEAAPETGSWLDWNRFTSRISDWLAKANREYQGTIVKELSKPAPGDAEAARLAAEKAAREQALAEAERAKAEQARLAAEAEARKKAASEAQAKAAAEAQKAAEARKQAEAAAQQKAAPQPSAAQQQTQSDKAAQEAEAAKLREAARVAEERRDQRLKEEQAQRVQAETERKAREAKAEQERKAKALSEAQAKLKAAEAERQRRLAEAAPAPREAPEPVLRHRKWAVTIIPEPIGRPEARERNDGGAVLVGARQLNGRMSLGAGSVRSGTAVKRWVMRDTSCRYAGQKRKRRYVVARGDSLWRISQKYYHRGSKYPRIYKANRDRIADPDLIYPCQKFRVPKR
jgi:nucleoid-associated protein YgaU